MTLRDVIESTLNTYCEGYYESLTEVILSAIEREGVWISRAPEDYWRNQVDPRNEKIPIQEVNARIGLLFDACEHEQPTVTRHDWLKDSG